MKITGAWIDRAATQAVMHMLAEAGHQALFVGGCVRNALLGAPVKDIDIATDAHPETVMKLAAQAGLKGVPTGFDHGTVTVVSSRIPHEVTTFRRDVETFGRHATVVFSQELSEDARRRDFTMNALYARADGTLIDPLGGLPDLRARRVRFIEDAAQRIAEDYLRILRFFRFHAWYGDAATGMDADALDAIARSIEGLAGLSRERVGAEMLTLLAAPDPAPALAAMRATGVLQMVLPGAQDRSLGPLIHAEILSAADPDPIRRLAALGGDDAPTRLRLSKADAKRLTLLCEVASNSQSAAELGYRHGADKARDILLLRAALLEQRPDPASMDTARQGALARFPISAADLMPGLQGAALGKRLATLEQVWIDSGFTLSRDDLLAQKT